ncbi:hypothetical protein D1632_15515 [Chryseobacterium nematophagum]|uniref:Uncharacterized protein n=1 Tax=Chryseobacterium nematophagum TaxID=2305228 RepID=A0A3M7LBS0_9FLAO|nr:hypothetical protein [Chryseobacterium nematophagum]RMZ58972.1 hypothetical protein D1632_15515 [Chryseobacterium nematophagum]
MYLTHDEIERVLDQVISIFLIPRFRELGMEATGEWLDTLEKESGENSGTIRGRSYSEQLAKGRKPGKMPPIEALEKWVQAKFSLSGEEAKNRAWAVSKKIEKEGTSWYQKGGTDLIEILSEPRTVQYIQDELSGIIKLRIAENLIRNTQEVLL